MRRLLLTLVVVVLALGAGLGIAFSVFLEQTRALPVEPLRPGAAPVGAIIVLTGGAERVETALRLLEAGAAPVLFVSGAHRSLTLAELARSHGRDAAALTGRVVLGHAAATTIGNAAEAAAFAQARGLTTLRLVTAGYHMPRAMLELRRALPGVTLLAHPVQPAVLRRDDTAAEAEGGLPARRRWTLLLGEFVKYGSAAAGITRFVPARESARR